MRSVSASSPRTRALVLFGLALALAACRESPSLRASRSSAPSSSSPSSSTPSSPPSTTLVGPRVRFDPAAAQGDPLALVAAHVTRARAEGRVPLVYVGASWCEPCRYFHQAAEHGELDDALPPLALLEFDRDRDGVRLDAAGYGSRMIPLFVSPDDDGHPSARRIEGSIHGPGSPREIVPRLLAILPASR